MDFSEPSKRSVRASEQALASAAFPAQLGHHHPTHDFVIVHCSLSHAPPAVPVLRCPNPPRASEFSDFIPLHRANYRPLRGRL